MINFKIILLTTCLLVSKSSDGFGQSRGNESSLIRLQISPKEYSAKLNSNREIILLDVRTPQEFEAGCIERARNINFYDESFVEEVSKLDRNRPIYVYCKSGGRSSEAFEKMANLGFTHLVNLKGGLMSWENDGFPKVTPANLKQTQDEMSESDYDKIIQENQKVLIDFFAPWCKPCQRMAPHIDKLALKYAYKVKVLKINYDKNQSISKKEKILALPSIILYSKGKKTYQGAKELNFSELEALIR